MQSYNLVSVSFAVGSYTVAYTDMGASGSQLGSGATKLPLEESSIKSSSLGPCRQNRPM